MSQEPELRVLHINQSDRQGGAAIAARRLVLAQRAMGVDAQMLVLRRTGTESWVHEFGAFSTRAKVRLARAFAKRYFRIASSTEPDAMRTMGFITTGLGAAIRRYAPDIVHWHWVGGEMASLEEIAGVEIPSVWTCHDQWAYCGAEHYADDDGFAAGYPNARWYDPDAWTFRRKLNAWRDWKPHLVCPSNWMSEQARRSKLADGLSSSVIPNTLDFEVFIAHERRQARQALGLPLDGRLLLFGAHLGTKDPRKGFDLLTEALRKMPAEERANLHLVAFGGAGKVEAVDGMPLLSLGVISDEAKLSLAYAAADAFVAPSRQDNLPNTLLEAQACGTPCVGFAVGGLQDIVNKPYHGRLVQPFDATDLARALVETCQPLGEDVRQAIRSDALYRYGREKTVAEHIRLYSSVLQSSRSNECEK